MTQFPNIQNGSSEKAQENLSNVESVKTHALINTTPSRAFSALHKDHSWGGAMDSVHLFILCELSSQIKPGDKVLDLGCGAAELLLKAAALHPQAHFTGIDSSEEALHIAKNRAASLKITNVNFLKTDITVIDSRTVGSYDVVMSVLNAHHLPDKTTLEKFHKNAERMVNENGSILIVEFTKSKSSQLIQTVTKSLLNRSPTHLAENCINSLQTGFSKTDFLESCAKMTLKLEHCSTHFADFLIVLRTPPKVPFFKQRAIWHIPLYKMTLKSWRDYALIKILCTKRSG